MLYKFFQVLMRWVLRVYFRKIYLAGEENIPSGKPVLLACNHPNSFMDAVLLAVLLPDPLHFLARSDVFDTAFKRWLLGKLHLIPIYRLEEGAENLHRNEETFDQCYRILQNNGRILIFSEGICILEKRLRPLKKGTARLAFGAESRYNFTLDLQLVPVGFNYTYPDQFRKEAMISIGDPIPVKSFEMLYQQQPSRALLELNKRLAASLRENMVIIENKEQEHSVEQLLVSHRLKSKEFNNHNWLVRSREWLEQEQQVIYRFMEATVRDLAADPPQKIPETGESGKMGRSGKVNLLFKKPFLLLVLPFAFTGLALNFLPFWLARKITRIKVKRIEFYSSVIMVTGMACYLLYWLALTLLGFVYSPATGLLLFILVPLSGYLTILFRDSWQYHQSLS